MIRKSFPLVLLHYWKVADEGGRFDEIAVIGGFAQRWTAFDYDDLALKSGVAGIMLVETR